MPVPKAGSWFAIRDGVLVLGKEVPVGQPECRGELFATLADAYLRGIRNVVVTHTDMVAELLGELRCFDAILTSRGLPRQRVRVAEAGTETARKAQEILEEKRSVEGRRAFFGLQPKDDTLSETGGLAGLQAMKAGSEGAVFAFVPVIDPARCTGCDACLRVCPQDVLTQIKDGSGAVRYTQNSSACDACGLCREVCSSSAIELETMAKRPEDIPLASWACTACGVQVHAPANSMRHQNLCHVCEQSGFHRKLFQVLS